MIENIKGHVIVVMAPTGSGKGTLIREALKVFTELRQTISCTTRGIRPGEEDGVDYHFVTQAQFDSKKEAGEFIESAYFGAQQYGTLKSEILPQLEAGKVVITEIELQGVEQLKALIPAEHITVVYIEAGGWEVLKNRVIKRAPISEEELAHRHERYLVEVSSKSIANVVIHNTGEDFTTAKHDFCDLVKKIMSLTYTD